MNIPKIWVLGSGEGSNFEAILSTKQTSTIPIVGLLCDRADAPIINRAKRHNIPTHSPHKGRWPNEILFKEIDNFIQSKPANIMVLAGFMRIIPEYIVTKLQNRIINLHPSLLPMYPGKDSIARSFHDRHNNGMKTGVSIHIVTKEVDQGPVLFQKEVMINDNDSLSDLEKRIHLCEHEILPHTLHYTLKNIDKKTSEIIKTTIPPL